MTLICRGHQHSIKRCGLAACSRKIDSGFFYVNLNCATRTTRARMQEFRLQAARV